MLRTTQDNRNRRILGIEFFSGSAQAAVERMKGGGLLVVPAAPALKDFDRASDYREAILNADLIITDSAFMVLIWNAMQHDDLQRLSGLKYLRALLLDEDVRRSGNTLWIMPSSVSATRNLGWLNQQGIAVPAENVYVAPMYGSDIEDSLLLDMIRRVRPEHIIVTVGGGTQERLGLYIKRQCGYRPAIHCIGAAIAFLSGDQVHIPTWADKYYVGWLFRSLSEPKRYVPRYWEARKLLALMLRHRENLPPLRIPSASARKHPSHSALSSDSR